MYTVNYRNRETIYHITVRQMSDGKSEMNVTVDGVEQHNNAIPLVDDHQERSVEVRIHVAGG